MTFEAKDIVWVLATKCAKGLYLDGYVYDKGLFKPKRKKIHYAAKIKQIKESNLHWVLAEITEANKVFYHIRVFGDSGNYYVTANMIKEKKWKSVDDR